MKSTDGGWMHHSLNQGLMAGSGCGGKVRRNGFSRLTGLALFSFGSGALDRRGFGESAAGSGQMTLEPNFPRTMSWSAYNLGTTGYNQAVAIGKALKDNYDVNLRVLPGKNDVSRLLPSTARSCAIFR